MRSPLDALVQAPPASGLDPVSLTVGLLGGLALFLLGMDSLSEALKAVAGDGMRRLLQALTKNRFLGVLTGAITTAVIQSSSITTVLVVGFISAGLMSMSQSIGVIMGANIGTTVTAQVLAFNISGASLPLVAVGFAMRIVSPRGALRHYGDGLIGLGLIFVGMFVMSTAMAPLRTYQPFVRWMVELESPLYGIAVSALFTALVQSSSATTGIVLAMASQGLLSLPAGIALIFGANIGTCVTALFAALGRTREAMRAVLIHVLFNVLGVLLWVGFIDQLAAAVVWLSPTAPDAAGSDKLAAELPRQLANAHTLFNVLNTAVFIGFADQLGRLARWIVPDRKHLTGPGSALDPGLIHAAPLALEAVRLEMLRLGEVVKAMLERAFPAVLNGSRAELEAVRRLDDDVDALHEALLEYMGRISQRSLTPRQTEELAELMGIANDLESIGDIVETNLVASGIRRLERQVQVSEATAGVISRFQRLVSDALGTALSAAMDKDAGAADRVVKMKREVNRLATQAARHQAQRLVAKEPNRLPAYAVERDILEHLKRVYYFSKRIARRVREMPAPSLPVPERVA